MARTSFTPVRPWIITTGVAGRDGDSTRYAIRTVEDTLCIAVAAAANEEAALPAMVTKCATTQWDASKLSVQHTWRDKAHWSLFL